MAGRTIGEAATAQLPALGNARLFENHTLAKVDASDDGQRAVCQPRQHSGHEVAADARKGAQEGRRDVDILDPDA